MARISSTKRDFVAAHIRSTNRRVTVLPLSGSLRFQVRSVLSSITLAKDLGIADAYVFQSDHQEPV
jgi:hypothetical protein